MESQTNWLFFVERRENSHKIKRSNEETDSEGEESEVTVSKVSRSVGENAAVRFMVDRLPSRPELLASILVWWVVQKTCYWRNFSDYWYLST